MSNGISFNFEFNSNSSANEKDPQVLNIAVLSDYSSKLQGMHKIDWESMDSLLEKFEPTIKFNVEGQEVSATITEIDDLHPDNLYRNMDVFKKLRDLKKRLKDPATFDMAAAELGIYKTSAPAGEENAVSSEGSLLEGLLGGKVDRPAKESAPVSQQAEGFISSIVGPYVIPDQDPRLDLCLNVVDLAMSGTMKSILHDSKFQHAESLWRGLDFVLKKVESDCQVNVYIVQCTKEELVAERTAEVLVEGYVGTGQWDLLVGAYEFNNSDLEILTGVNKLCSHTGGKFISSFKLSEGELDKSEDVDPFFEELKKLSSISLTAPRFLLRYPYGENTDEIDSFPFEEWDNNFEHSDYLWTNAAFAVTALKIQAFDTNQRVPAVINGLPVHVVDSQTTPTAEFWLSDRQVDKLIQLGLVPVIAIRGRDSIEIAGAF